MYVCACVYDEEKKKRKTDEKLEGWCTHGKRAEAKIEEKNHLLSPLWNSARVAQIK